MIPENRRYEILSILKQQGYCSVESLAKSVYVSVPTMRRDLTQLEKEGFIKRIHGGASYFKRDMPMLPFDLRNKAMIKEKIRIGEAAVRLLNDHDTVFMDSCSTCLCAARAIDPRMHLTVLTNSIVIAQTLADNPNLHVEIVGGAYDAKNLSVYGQEAEQYIASRHARYCFVTVNSVDPNFGMSNLSALDIPVKKAFAKHADQVVLLIDSSRLMRKNYYKVFDFEEIDILITDKELDEQLMKKCRDSGIEVILA